jgi:hypothetical protein
MLSKLDEPSKTRSKYRALNAILTYFSNQKASLFRVILIAFLLGLSILVVGSIFALISSLTSISLFGVALTGGAVFVATLIAASLVGFITLTVGIIGISLYNKMYPEYKENELLKNIDTKVFIHEIMPYFGDNSKELSNLMLLNKGYHAVFQKPQHERLERALVKLLNKGKNDIANKISNQYPEFKIKQLLWYIASGNQDEAKKMLEDDPTLLLKRGSVIDFSGREFKDISPFELGLYNFDTHMLHMILERISEVEDGEPRKQIIDELKQQYKTVFEDYDKEKGTDGIRYTLNGKEYHEKHFDLQPLIDAVQEYDTNYHNWNNDERKKHWCTVVGKLQVLLPAHVRQEYCHPRRSFNPTPDFKENTLDRSLKFYNYIKSDFQVWDGLLTGLGVDFGICRGREAGGGVGAAAARPPARAARTDSLALTSLFKTRTEQIVSIKDYLNSLGQRQEDNKNSLEMNL